MDPQDDTVQEYLNTMYEEGYTSAINTYTRVQGSSKSCLDHIFLKSKLPLENFVPITWRINITDHKPVLLVVESPEKKIKIDRMRNGTKYEFIINYDRLKNILML
ncbi:hypothetical protein HHI36_008072 [Cryptolaemus montrouzieri]|uniref:Uncharacterized protein n=1 Tax=Cryptolaemus montrouzieri TaxID=559131 RepID=A0ABD2MRE4_9CUCU